MRFTLTVNEAERDGFKLSVQSDNEKELAVVKELTDKLIEKIKTIEVKVVQYNE